MKKSNILLFTALAILWLVCLVIKPLQGIVFADPLSHEPRDIVSAFVKNFDNSDKMEKVSLDGIKNIKVIGYDKNTFLSVGYADTTSISVKQSNQLINFDHKKIGDTLQVTLSKKVFSDVELILNPEQTYSLTVENFRGSIEIIPTDSVAKGLNKIAVLKNSSPRIRNYSRESQNFSNPFSMQIAGKSKVNLDNISFSKLDVKLNDGMLEVFNNNHIDSLNADLQGLSNIIVGKHPEDKRVKSLVLSGNLDYYNSRRPQ